ncbi:hypothetical protein [Azospirillum sp. B510]|uniref:hypothetical protein n=1 Tax=Azospirillum sp. (strain B510) TaxID=137722 RepID=UPI001FFE5CC5|nr:hypothetical protein [Azospirillum sp. B510]
MAGAITDYNGPNVTLAGGAALKKFMENTAAAAKKKIEETGSVEGFKAGFTSANGEISINITSKPIIESSGRSGYGLFYSLDTNDQGVQVAGSQGIIGTTFNSDDVDKFVSMISETNDSLGTKSGHMTEEEELQWAKRNLSPDQYDKIVQGMKESKAAYEAQQKELRGEKGDGSSPASGGGTRLDRMKARSEDTARLAERLLKGATGRDQSGAAGAAELLISSLKAPATDKPSAPNSDAAASPPAYKPVDLKA